MVLWMIWGSASRASFLRGEQQTERSVVICSLGAVDCVVYHSLSLL